MGSITGKHKQNLSGHELSIVWPSADGRTLASQGGDDTNAVTGARPDT